MIALLFMSKYEGALGLLTAALYSNVALKRLNRRTIMIENAEDCLKALAKDGALREEAAAWLYEHRAGRIRRMFPHIPNASSADIDDFVQDVLLRIVRHAASFSGQAPADAWIWRIAHNRAQDYLRDFIGQHQINAGVDTETLGEENKIDGAVGLDECVRRAFELFRRRFPEKAHALQLGVVLGLTSKELGEVINRSADATRQFLSGCRSSLKPFLELCRDYLEA